LKLSSLKVLSIIPARGGSKGVPRKNIKDLNGKPLIAYSIESSLESSFIDITVVTSEDEEIIQVSKKLGADVIYRPKELASDAASTMPVVKHALDKLLSRGKSFDIVIVLQPTSPLRDSDTIDKAFKLFTEQDADALISVTELDIEVFKSFVINKDGYLSGAINSKYPFTRRQDLPKAYLANGAIYMIKTKVFNENKTLITDKTVPFIMKKENSVNIDTQEDFNRASELLRVKK